MAVTKMNTESDGKKLGNGRYCKLRHEDFISQNEERKWVETLLDCSLQKEEFVPFNNSAGWEEVGVGWKLTVPNIIYKSSVSELSVTNNPEKDKDNIKNKTLSSNKLSPHIISDQSWKQCVEPDTYRYIPKATYPGVLKKATVSKGPVKRPMDAQLQEHIRRVKEHLEKVLVEQAQPMGEKRVLGAVHPHGNYVSSLIRQAKSNRQRPLPVLRYSPRNDKQTEDQGKTKVPDVGLTYTVKQNSPIQKNLPSQDQVQFKNANVGLTVSKKSQPLQAHKLENKLPIDLVAALGHKLNELIEQDKHKTRATKFTEYSMCAEGDNLRSSFEKFACPSLTESPDLKPLVKVTAGQRKVHDDNEIIGAVAKLNHRVNSDGYFSLHTSPVPDQILQSIKTESVTNNSNNQLGCGHVDHVNRNFFARGITGKAVSHASVQMQTPTIIGDSRIVMSNSKNPAKVRKRGTLHPTREVHHVARRVEHGPSVATRLGDPLHRGVVDREVAGVIASQLLPGVRGHNILFPLQLQPYRIV